MSQAGDWDAARVQLYHHPPNPEYPRQLAQSSSPSWPPLQLTRPVCGWLPVHRDDQWRQQDGCHIPVQRGSPQLRPSRLWPLQESSCKTCLGMQMQLSCPPSMCHPNQTPREPQPSPSTPPGHGLLLPALCHGPQAQWRGQPWGTGSQRALGCPHCRARDSPHRCLNIKWFC